MNTAIETQVQELAGLALGDHVVLMRNLDHPAWKKQVPADPRSGADTQWMRDPEIEELLGRTTVLDRRHIPAVAGWGGREEKTLVRLVNGFWYDCATGLQDGSAATKIELG